MITFRVELDQETDGRWIAEVVGLPGVLAYGGSSDEAKAKVQALALRVVADRLEHGEAGPDLLICIPRRQRDWTAHARPPGKAHGGTA